MSLEFKRSNVIRGALIYSIGDTIATLIPNEFDPYRLLGILFIGATIYAFEIPNYFNWIDRKVNESNQLLNSLKRTLLAIAYFNPLWISRHLLFILIFSGKINEINSNLLYIGLISFLVNIPSSIIANYLIQNKINLKYRFISSAIFSGLMAIYYSLSIVWFG